MRAALGHAASYIPRVIAHAVTFASGIITSIIKPATDSTTAIQFQNAAGTPVVTIDTTNSFMGVNVPAAPGASLDIVRFTAAANSISSALLLERTTSGTATTGFGTAQSVFLQNSAGTLYSSSRMVTSYVSATATAELVKLNFWVGQAANTASTSAGIKFSIFGNGNIGINTELFGDNALKVIAVGSGTAPTTSPADVSQLWSADQGATAGNAGLHIRSETGAVHSLGAYTVLPSYVQLSEIAAPGAGAANTARLYIKDNGAGKSQLMIQFASGGEIQLAIEA